jgi:hypothetical protein
MGLSNSGIVEAGQLNLRPFCVLGIMPDFIASELAKALR